jgi:hypothetical protein
VYKYRLESSVVLRHSRSSDLAMLILNGTLVFGPKSTLLKKVKRSLPACSSTPTAARRLRASAYCESGKLCLQYHPLAPLSSAREPLCTTVVSPAGTRTHPVSNGIAPFCFFAIRLIRLTINYAYLKRCS